MNYQRLFEQLNQLLEDTQPLWQVRSFDHQCLPWLEQYPQFCRWLSELTLEQTHQLNNDQDRLNECLLAELQAEMDQHLHQQLSQLLDFRVKPLAATEDIDFEDKSYFQAHIKGPKWQQIVRFNQQLDDSLDTLEWCGGKGHLGRLFAKVNNRKVTTLEWQASLCEQGEQFAHLWQLPQKFICGDAFNADSDVFSQVQQAAALHACGDLHVELLKQSSQQQLQSVVVSPCCYHLINVDCYQPLAAIAKNSRLLLAKADLQIPLQKQRLESTKTQSQRDQKMAYRLGFDALYKAQYPNQPYMPVPTIKPQQLNASFKDFCLWVAEVKSIELAKFDAQQYFVTGKNRLVLIRQIDLVKHLFRDLIELWLVLDRVLFMQEQGYQVELGSFCDESLTPRNILIKANKA
ncbi:methyltransferase [Paraferrimonas sp. SM1919]|uniref:methyltransferase n=1 Tax=Paraferrimonas sp. SM1919 TaxID=2662263 RepID=UPI0013D7DE16|nr:methyltransferase [Paraferrimonas sp. SM1919]